MSGKLSPYYNEHKTDVSNIKDVHLESEKKSTFSVTIRNIIGCPGLVIAEDPLNKNILCLSTDHGFYVSQTPWHILESMEQGFALVCPYSSYC